MEATPLIADGVMYVTAAWSVLYALDASTGAPLWKYDPQVPKSWRTYACCDVPNRGAALWGDKVYVATQHMILADIDFGGGVRKVLMQAPKNGFFYMLDRQTGKLINADAYVPLNWASHVDLDTGRPVELDGARYEQNYKVIFPSSWGGHNWHPMSYSPQTGLVYVPLLGQAETFANWKEFAFVENHLNLGLDYEASSKVTPEELAEHPQIAVRISAWDPVARKEVFRIDSGSAWNAGILSTAGNLVFQGEASGEFAAYAADSGEQLWSAYANTGIMAPPVTFEVDGEQYVTVVGGWGIHMGSFEGDPTGDENRDAIGRILTYKLGGPLREGRSG